MREIKVVTVVGVTGTMGAKIAGIFASFGGAKVYCVGRSIDKVRHSLPKIIRSVRADSISDRLIPADYTELGPCVSESDLIFESTAENMAVKREVACAVAASMRPEAIACTGTSGLSVTKLAECYPEPIRGHFFGVHMFNPPYNMPLCELISTPYSDLHMLGDLRHYLENKLFRTVVEVKDSPAFLGNRIGFQFINEALQYAEKYRDNGGIDYIDAILGPFTGRSMPPLTTSDFVGLDVHRAIVDNVYENTQDYAHDTFVLPEYVKALILEGHLGRKSGGGLYRLIKYDNGFKRMMVYDISTGLYRDVFPYVFPFAEDMKQFISEGDYRKAFEVLMRNRSQEARICRHFLLNYIAYSLYAAKEVGYAIDAADDVMAAGFNWCPPLAMAEALWAVADVRSLIAQEPMSDISTSIFDDLPLHREPSKYDYRRYFRSGR